MKRVAAIASALILGVSACGDDSETDLGAEESTTNVAGADSEFRTLDANGDSYLDVDEVAEWADDTGVFTVWDVDADSELDRDEITGNVFQLWDADGNGVVSETEWENGVDLWYPGDAGPVVFRDLDNDGDSELDSDEFSERVDLSPLGESWTVESFDQKMFRTAYFELYDTDNDGRVSELEWTNGAASFGSPNE